jgi:hypothetical protein
VPGVVAKERIGLDERASTNDDFRAALGDEVEGGEVLEDADRIVGAENGYGGCEANAPSASGRGCEQHSGRRGDVLFAVVFANAVDIDSDAIGKLDLLKQLTDSLGASSPGERPEPTIAST